MLSFKNWLNESKEVISIDGWKKITKTNFIKTLSDNKSLLLYVLPVITYNKVNEIQVDLSKLTDSKLKQLVKDRKMRGEWRNLKSVSNAKLVFDGSDGQSSLSMTQIGDKMFFEKKIGDGVVYMYLNVHYDSSWDEFANKIILYYVE